MPPSPLPFSSRTRAAKSTEARMPARKTRSKTRKWSAKVTQRSDAMDLENRVFKQKDPKRIARSLKRSAARSTRRKAGPYQSAMSMLNFYTNRAGKNLPAAQKKKLGRAKGELRKLFGRADAKKKPPTRRAPARRG